MGKRHPAVEGVALMERQFWHGRRVLVTGHTGFKGAWLSMWLANLGAEVTGYALPPVASPNLYEILSINRRVNSTFADINDRTALQAAIDRAQPEIVLHLAAQALVRDSYIDPVSTFATNVTGVVTLLDIVRKLQGIQAVLIVTSDKCYENNEWFWGYRETDPLGGRDPYSASKGCAEIATRSMQRSFFAPYNAAGHPAGIATARAGNVIGGGDWSGHRLVPDIVRGCLGAEGLVRLRNPAAIRPWQHVLEPLDAYLRITEHLIRYPEDMGGSWNIGPDQSEENTVINVAEAMVRELGHGRVVVETDSNAPHEAHHLRLDCSKLKTKLGWTPKLSFEASIQMTGAWYAAWNSGADMVAFTERQIAEYAAIPLNL
jgi:CDP-glucose 4,6-dehydratase